MKAFAVGDKNTGTRREKLLVILNHKITTGRLFPHCAHPIEMFLAGRHTACLCSQTCEGVGVVKRVHTLQGGVHKLATALNVVEEVQEEVQEIKYE